MGSHSSSRPTRDRMTRVLAWPRSPSRMMSWPARMAFSSWGTTVSSKPSTPGTSGSPEAMRAAVLRRISSATGTDSQPEARRSPRVRARSAGGVGASRARGSRRGQCVRGRPWAKPVTTPIRWRSAVGRSAGLGAIGPRRRPWPRAASCVRQRPAGRGTGAVAAVGQGDRCGSSPGRREGDGGQRAVGRHGDGRHHGRAQPGRHEGEDAVHLAALAHQVRLDAGRHGRRPGSRRAGRSPHGTSPAASPSRSRHPHPAPAASGWSGATARTRGSSKSGVVATRGSVTGSTTRARSTSPLASWGTSWRDPASTTEQFDARVAGVELDQGRGEHAGDQAGRGADGQPAPGHARRARASAPVASTSARTRRHERQEGLAVGGEGDQALARARG